jgi:hypothetical protein
VKPGFAWSVAIFMLKLRGYFIILMASLIMWRQLRHVGYDFCSIKVDTVLGLSACVATTNC